MFIKGALFHPLFTCLGERYFSMEEVPGVMVFYFFFVEPTRLAVKPGFGWWEIIE